MAPYRDDARTRHAERPEASLVTDMVRQFADPYAFLRELVQNGIDAGATRLHVVIGYDGETLTTSVTDDGKGMTREVIEGPLLTLFASSKEGDGESIGKYGVGFVSVFALAPDEVLIETWRREGSYGVRLRPDYGYDLLAERPREASGTTVTLSFANPPFTYADHVTKCRAALRRWCRHASVPIDLAVGFGPDVAPAREKIDTPFSLSAPAVASFRDGPDQAFVGYVEGTALLPDGGGLHEGSGPFTGYYNRGLTLFETTEVAKDLPGLRMKVMSRSLSHTLSRDNVRIDDAYERVMNRVRELAREHLPVELAHRLAESAARAAAGRGAPLLAAQLVAAVRHLDASRVVLPLWHDVDGERTTRLAAILKERSKRAPLVAAREAGSVTEALARRGVHVVRTCVDGEDTGVPDAIFRHVAAAAKREVVSATGHYGLAERTVDPAASRSLEELRGALDAIGLGFAEVHLCRTSGLLAGRAGLTLPSNSEDVMLIEPGDLGRWAGRWGAMRRALWLNGDHPVVRAWKAAPARVRPAAASVVVRVVVSEWRGALTAEESDDLLHHVLTSLGDAANAEAGR